MGRFRGEEMTSDDVVCDGCTSVGGKAGFLEIGR
jgi:hypothetical protein